MSLQGIANGLFLLAVFTYPEVGSFLRMRFVVAAGGKMV